MPGNLIRDTKAVPVYIADDDGNPVAVGGGGGGGGVVTQGTASNLNAQVVGNSGAAATDSGNPVKIGGVFNTTLPTYTTGQRGDAQMDARGGLFVVLKNTGGTSSVDIGLASADGNPMLTGIATRSYGLVWNGTAWDRQRGDTNGTYSVSKGSGTIATAQVSVGTASTQIVAARAGRGAVTITNLGTTDVFIGVTGVSATTGTLLLGSKGASITIPTNAAVFGIAATAQSVSVLEVY